MLVLIGDFEERVASTLAGGGAEEGLIAQHGQQKRRHHLGAVPVHLVLLHEDILQGPHLEALDVPEAAVLVKVRPRVWTVEDNLARDGTKQLNDHGNVVFVAVKVAPAVWIKEIIARCEFKGQRRDAPNVCALVVAVAQDGFEAAVLACLDHRSKVLVNPASVAQIRNLDVACLEKLFVKQLLLQGT